MPSRSRRRVSILLLLLAAAPCALAAQGTEHYHVVRRLKVGGDGFWDYLTADPSAHRLYVSRGTHVMVVDTDRNQVIGDIPNTSGVHGIALAPELGRGFTSNGRDSTVTIFDLKSLAEIGRVHVPGANPDAILYEPVTKRVFTFNGRSGDASAIDAATGQVVGSIPLGGKPEFSAYDGKGSVFVNIEDKSELVRFDASTLKETGRFPLAPCEEPSGLAIDRATRRLFSVCGNKTMVVVNGDDGKLVATLPIGAGVDGVAFDDGRKLAFASAGRDSTITVVREEAPDRFSVLETVPTMPGARTIAADDRTHKVYTVSAEFEQAPTQQAAGAPRRRPAMVPGSFTILVLDR